jgi:hypothetical protein
MHSLTKETLELISEQGIFRTTKLLRKQHPDKKVLERACATFISRIAIEVMNNTEKLHEKDDCGEDNCIKCLVFKRNLDFWKNLY